MTQSKHILLVEDHEDIAEGITNLLDAIFNKKLEVTHATNLADAKRISEKLHFDAIITDNNFPSEPSLKPSENGIPLIQQVRAGEWGNENTQLPILFQSGDATQLTLQRARSAGATTCRSKTGPLEVLETFLQRVIDNQPPIASVSR